MKRMFCARYATDSTASAALIADAVALSISYTTQVTLSNGEIWIGLLGDRDDVKAVIYRYESGGSPTYDESSRSWPTTLADPGPTDADVAPVTVLLSAMGC